MHDKLAAINTMTLSYNLTLSFNLPIAFTVYLCTHQFKVVEEVIKPMG